MDCPKHGAILRVAMIRAVRIYRFTLPFMTIYQPDNMTKFMEKQIAPKSTSKQGNRLMYTIL